MSNFMQLIVCIRILRILRINCDTCTWR